MKEVSSISYKHYATTRNVNLCIFINRILLRFKRNLNGSDQIHFRPILDAYPKISSITINLFFTVNQPQPFVILFLLSPVSVMMNHNGRCLGAR